MLKKVVQNQEDESTKKTSTVKKIEPFPWQKLEQAWFTDQRQKFYLENPNLGPPGSAPNLFSLPTIHRPTNQRITELKELVKGLGQSGGLTTTQYASNVTIVHETNQTTPLRGVTSGIKLCQYLLGGQGLAHFDGKEIKLSLKAPSIIAHDLVNPLLVGFHTNEQYSGGPLAGCQLFGPATLLALDRGRMGIVRRSLWNNVPEPTKSNWLESENYTAQQETSLLIRLPQTSAASGPAQQRELVKSLLDDFKYTPDQLTIIIIRPDSFLDNFVQASKLLGSTCVSIQQRSAKHNDSSIAKIELSAPLGLHLEDFSKVRLEIRGTTNFDQLCQNLNQLSYKPLHAHQVELALEEQYLEDRSNDINRVTYNGLL